MIEPVYVYYRISNFYNNHKDFSKSRDNSQIRGEIIKYDELDDGCENQKMVKNMFRDEHEKYHTYAGNEISAHAVANPCGLIAKNFFKDQFEILNGSEHKIKISEKGIADYYDVNYNFKRNENSKNTQIIDVEDGKVYI